MQALTLDARHQERVTAAMAQCPLFQALKPEHYAQILKIAEAQHFDPEEAIVLQGEPSDSFFVLVEGAAAVRVKNPGGDSVDIGRVPMPSSVGEVGLLLGVPRTASVIAIEEVTALRFPGKAFTAMFQKVPEFGWAISAGLAHRLQQVSSKMPLPDYDTRKGAPSAEVLGLLPFEFVQRHRVLPLEVKGNALTLGVVDDPTTATLSAVRSHTPGMDLHVVRIDLAFFSEALKSRAGVKEWTGRMPVVAAAAAPEPRSPKLDALLERTVAEGASDLHLAAGQQPHWRIDGDIRAIADASALGAKEVLDLLTPVLEARHREQFASDSDTDLAYALPGVGRFRVNVFRDRNGVGAAFRQIPSKIVTLDQLGMPPILKTLCDFPKGLVLVTGPTGCGKSTTLAAMIDYIKQGRRSHIITLEDPIEFVHESGNCLINQREIGGHTTSFARALRAALREDPDVVLVGEMRDTETIALALETANTGHLVLATLHTNSAISTVDRIVDQFPADRQPQVRNTLSDVLRGVVAQSLCKKIGGGRIAAVEVLVVNYAVANLIRESKTSQIPGIMQAGRAHGMKLLNEDLAQLVDARKIEMEEALSRSVDKEDLLRRYRSGLTLADDPAGGRFRVVAVKENSPAAAAGLARGDLVVEIETRPADGFTLEEARVFLRSDGRHNLTVERGGKRFKVVMELTR
jgi:twitching motility protein PilT